MKTWWGVMMCVALTACGETAVGGEVAVRIADHASTVVMPTECAQSGSARGAGVELWDDTGWSFQFRHDSRTGASLAIWMPSGEPVAVLEHDECEVFHGELRQRTDLEDEPMQVTYGHLHLQCQRDDGVAVAGELDFDRCLAR
jgi:hypothetical protein